MCKVCEHPNRKKIDAAIVSGTKNPTIFHEFINSGNKESWIQALKDHKRYNHVKEKIKKAQESKDVQEGIDLRQAAQEIFDIAKGSAQDARAAKQFGAVGGCLGPAIKVLELLTPKTESPEQSPKESGFMAGYLKRAGEVYEKESPPSQ